MALITIQPNGQVCLTGSPTLCQVLKGTKGQDILEVAEKSVNKAVVPEPCKTVDLRNIDVFGLSLEDLHSTLCRKIYSRLCFNKGAKERGTYHQTQKPEYWPKEVPFCSHSAKGPDGKGRMISINQIKEVLECFRSYCAELQKLAGLEKGKHQKRQFNHEELQSFSVDDVVMEEAQHNDEKEDEEMADLIYHNEWQSIGTDRKVKGVGQDIGEVDINIDELKHEELSEIRLEETGSGSTIQQLLNKNDIDGCISYIVKNWPLEHEIEHIAAYLQRSKPIQIDSMPDRFAKRRYRGPSDMVPGKEYSNIWEVLHEFPSLARLHVFLFATEHIDHYVAQYEEMDSSLYEIKLAMKRFESSAPTIKDFFTEEALSVLTDMMRGPITYMLIAGALKATITIYEMNRGAISFPPCPCDEADSQQFIWIDRRERVFGLSQEHVWSGKLF
ncbi:uncharacterized protein LOC132739766 isoform X2 [Ruditapes philippinarum]|uniref:uncharacterized protein LOC132739766 isoform X2 n=1 Tax=Ruditapes philippinarum TaxID=129788 RepID=UPI00295A5CB1|nr:uncharacterized protein LOC132739766 isoform X2 [Ruditapes philippinarum]